MFGRLNGEFRVVKGAPGGRQQEAWGRINRWSVKHNWVARAAAWDREVDEFVRERQRDEIARMRAENAAVAEAYAGMNRLAGDDDAPAHEYAGRPGQDRSLAAFPLRTDGFAMCVGDCSTSAPFITARTLSISASGSPSSAARSVRLAGQQPGKNRAHARGACGDRQGILRSHVNDGPAF